MAEMDGQYYRGFGRETHKPRIENFGEIAYNKGLFVNKLTGEKKEEKKKILL